MEENIRKLCSELAREQDPEKVRQLAICLRQKLHEHMQSTRDKLDAIGVASSRPQATGHGADEAFSGITLVVVAPEFLRRL